MKETNGSNTLEKFGHEEGEKNREVTPRGKERTEQDYLLLLSTMFLR